MSEERDNKPSSPSSPSSVPSADRRLSSWGAAGVAAELVKMGAEAAEKEELQKAYIYYELSLQYQPERSLPRQKMVAINDKSELRGEVLDEVDSLVAKHAGEGQEISRSQCPQCQTSNPEGVRICRCGYRYPVTQVADSTMFGDATTTAPVVANSGTPSWITILGLLVIIALQVAILVSSPSVPEKKKDDNTSTETVSSEDVDKLREDMTNLISVLTTAIVEVDTKAGDLQEKMKQIQTDGQSGGDLAEKLKKVEAKLDQILKDLEARKKKDNSEKKK